MHLLYRNIFLTFFANILSLKIFILLFSLQVYLQPLVLYKKVTANSKGKKHRILVLPSYDPIAGRGITPSVSDYLTEAIKTESNLQLVEFDYKKIKGLNTSRVFDKKFCSPFVKIWHPDYILLSKTELVKETGNMETDLWNIHFKIYDVKKNKQMQTAFFIDSANAAAVKKMISGNISRITGFR
jgi:hypothetical protein